MLNITSLREQVYQYLSNQIQAGELRPGSIIRLDKLSRELQVSKTPTKEAIIQLECEGFVEILPRRGIIVKKLTYQDIKDLYEIIGSLESTVLISVFDQISEKNIKKMKRSNEAQLNALEGNEFNRYYQLNLEFHNYFLNLSSNMTLQRYIAPIKQRLYDFTRREYLKKWEMINLQEHDELIKMIEAGDREGAALVIKEQHWGWKIHEPYFKKYYELNNASENLDDIE